MMVQVCGRRKEGLPSPSPPFQNQNPPPSAQCGTMQTCFLFRFPFLSSGWAVGKGRATMTNRPFLLTLDWEETGRGGWWNGKNPNFPMLLSPPPRKRQWLQLIIPTSSGCTTHPRLVADTARDTQREGRETKINCPIRPTAAFLSYYFETRKKPRRFTKISQQYVSI